MKETTYKCDVCGKPCNGGGFSYEVQHKLGDSNDYRLIYISKDFNDVGSHVCGHEHFLQVVSKVLQELEK